MPTYDYECQGCGYKFELFQSMTSDPVEDCPKCQGSVKRLIGNGAGIIFKGSGFYETDYKKKEKKEESKDEKPPACPMSKECKGCSTPKE
jgi:putative FmdB family regulatory protein